MIFHRRHIVVGALANAIFGKAASVRACADEQGVVNAQTYAGDMLISGFEGTDARSASAQALSAHIRAGRIAGVVFVKDNIGERADVAELVRFFSADAPKRVLMAIDHEGGAVQRLTEIHGCAPLPAARKVANAYTVPEARALYCAAGHTLAALGFNFNLAPVVDLHCADNPAVGHFDRAFSDDPARVVAYAEAFVDGFGEAGVRCALKHFPGQGGARDDSHFVSPSLTDWSKADLAPFRGLINAGKADAVMSGFAHLPGDAPAALSARVMTGMLRDELAFDGVALTDDLDMGAVGSAANRPMVAIEALRAGNDLVMIRNRTNPDADLPGSLARWIDAALKSGALSRQSLDKSRLRIAALRERLLAPP